MFLTVVVACAGAGSAADADTPARLRFALHGKQVAEVALKELKARPDAQVVKVREPYEDADVEFRALPFAALLDSIYSKSWRAQEEILFTCSDGYQPTVSVERIIGHRAFLAFDRVGETGFTLHKLESGKTKRVELGPTYLVWDNRNDPQILREGDYGWPYQVVSVDLIRTGDRFPLSTPPSTSNKEVLAGHAAFRRYCSRCHQVNGEGGTIGPELNLAANPTEYRETDWLMRWIDNPASIRPDTRMPALDASVPNRTQTIEELIAYLRLMADLRRGSEPAQSDDTGASHAQ